MSLTLPRPSAQYDQSNEAQTRSSIERNDLDLMRITHDVDISKRRLIIPSPDGTRFSITVADDGTISATAI